jgi:adenine/guanine/hypoxanthine permease
MHTKRYQWATLGDINAFFGLLLDNIAGLFLILSILSGVFQMPAEFVMTHMIPGTAIGVFVGDLWFFFMAFRLAKTTGKDNVTAMPLGLDTPSIFGFTFLVLGPAYKTALASGLTEIDAANQAWHVGIFCMVASGVFKFICAFFSEWVRRIVPRAGLLGSLTAIALVVISFLPLLDVMLVPAVGMIALAIVLVSLLGHVPMPKNIPGSVVALLVSGLIYYIMFAFDWLPVERPEAMPFTFASTDWLQALYFDWWKDRWLAINYLPIALPFALATVVGGIDCTESAAAVGDRYKTNHIIGVEAFATVLAGLLGGVIQTTPYIGHPAYKAMGGRAAYTLATAICMIVIGLLGIFVVFYTYVPKAAVYPLLVFVGLEITSQSFFATPRRHYPAVAFACVPALAYLSVFFVKQLLAHPLVSAGASLDSIGGELASSINTAILLSNGFILVSLVWASGLAFAIDRRLKAAAITFGIGAIFTMFGVIHSPRPDNNLFLPISSEWLSPAWRLDAQYASPMWGLFAGYVLTALAFYAWSFFTEPIPIESEEN